jgi:putative endonuclease
MSRQQGEQYELLAANYLLTAGCNIIEKNYQARFGEIDLIVMDGQELAFIEVKYRASLQFGGANHAVTKSKQRKIIKTAQLYLVTHKKYDKMACRFDVLCIDSSLTIEWLKHAFML